MGAFRFIQGTMADIFDLKVNGICRDESATPAVGSSKVHAIEQELILATAVGSRDGDASSNEKSTGRTANSA